MNPTKAIHLKSKIKVKVNFMISGLVKLVKRVQKFHVKAKMNTNTIFLVL